MSSLVIQFNFTKKSTLTEKNFKLVKKDLMKYLKENPKIFVEQNDKIFINYVLN
jgi:hypothetical protein